MKKSSQFESLSRLRGHLKAITVAVLIATVAGLPAVSAADKGNKGGQGGKKEERREQRNENREQQRENRQERREDRQERREEQQQNRQEKREDKQERREDKRDDKQERREEKRDDRQDRREDKREDKQERREEKREARQERREAERIRHEERRQQQERSFTPEQRQRIESDRRNVQNRHNQVWNERKERKIFRREVRKIVRQEVRREFRREMRRIRRGPYAYMSWRGDYWVIDHSYWRPRYDRWWRGTFYPDPIFVIYSAPTYRFVLYSPYDNWTFDHSRLLSAGSTISGLATSIHERAQYEPFDGEQQKNSALWSLYDLVMDARAFTDSLIQGGTNLNASIYELLILEESLYEAAPFIYDGRVAKPLEADFNMVSSLVSQAVRIFRDRVYGFDSYRTNLGKRILDMSETVDSLSWNFYRQAKVELPNVGGWNDQALSSFYDVAEAAGIFADAIKDNSSQDSIFELFHLEDMVNRAEQFATASNLSEATRQSFKLLDYYVEELMWTYRQNAPIPLR